MVEFGALNCLKNLECTLLQAFGCLNNKENVCILWTQIFFIATLMVAHHCTIPFCSQKISFKKYSVLCSNPTNEVKLS